MIRGTVTGYREARIRLLVHGPGGRRQRVQALIDTGFDGWLSLPPTILAALGLPWRRRGRALLADGRQTVFDIFFEGTVVWDRRRRRIPIDQANTSPLVGMALLEGYELRMQVKPGGTVRLTRLP